MSTGILVSTFAPPTFTKWSSRTTNSVYSLTSATVSTARLATLWIPIRSLSGLHLRVEGDQITRICERFARVPGSKFQVPGFKFQVPGFKFQVPDSRFQVSSFKFQVSVWNLFGIWDFEFPLTGSAVSPHHSVLSFCAVTRKTASSPNQRESRKIPPPRISNRWVPLFQKSRILITMAVRVVISMNTMGTPVYQ